MKWFNPKYLMISQEMGLFFVTEVFLGDPEKCQYGGKATFYGDHGEQVDLRFPMDCSDLCEALLNCGDRFAYIADDDPPPYTEIAVNYDHLGRTFIVGCSVEGRFYVHCKLNNGHGFITSV